MSDNYATSFTVVLTRPAVFGHTSTQLLNTHIIRHISLSWMSYFCKKRTCSSLYFACI